MWDDAVDMQARLAALKEGAADERASIVAWLRRLAEQDGLSNEVMGAVAHLAVGIERGDHTRQEEGEQA